MDPTLNLKAERLIWVAQPWLGNEEAQAVFDAVTDNWISQGPRVKKFEKAIAQSTGKTYGSACNSGTTALHLALHICDVTVGDEVIIPNLTMVALANAVLLTHATPVFCDSSLLSEVGNISYESVKSLITEKTKAVILVHTYGEPVEDIQLIVSYCKAKGIKVIEDCAECHFGTYEDQPLGSFSDIAIFSFYSNKNITTGEGGMFTTDSLEIKERLDRVRMHAFTPGKHFCHTERAFGYRMTDLQAAIGLEQFAKAEIFMSRRKKIREMYEHGLAGVRHLTIPKTSDTSAHWVMPLLAKNSNQRDAIREQIADKGIDSRTYFQPMNEQAFLQEFSVGKYPRSRELSKRGFYVPLYPKLSDDEVDYVIEALRTFWS